MKKKKNAREKSILICAVSIAGVMVAGSTFAWFTSKDEVTNRLSASASYPVTIAEDFTPTENWVPGQTINKDVGAVNTGNIDALVRAHLEGEMNILGETAVASEIDVKTGFGSTALTDVTDADLLALGLTKKDANGNFYRTLSTTERTNPNLAGNGDDTASDGSAIEGDQDNTYSEVEAVQSGGWLAYASGGFKFTPENAGYTYVSTDTGNPTKTQTTPTALASTDIKDTWTNGAGLAIDSDTFVPTSTGLFIFRRDITTTSSDGHDYEFTGYYAVVDGTNVTYYALHYLPSTLSNSDCVIYSTATVKQETGGTALTVTYETDGDKKTPIKSVVPTSVKAFSASYTRIENMVGTYTAADTTATPAKPATVTFSNGATDADKKIEIVVALDNINDSATADTAETWTHVTESGSHTYFYYNNDVEEGDSTSKLVDSVKLAAETEPPAYLAFDFDLSVLLDSIQVTMDESGKETMPQAKPWNPGATGTATNSGSEISTIAWS